MVTVSDRDIVVLARAVRLAVSGEARARALDRLFEAIDKRDGIKAQEVR